MGAEPGTAASSCRAMAALTLAHRGSPEHATSNDIAATVSADQSVAGTSMSPNPSTSVAASRRAELNFLQEARNGERLAAMLAHDARVHVPAVHRALSSERVLVMEWIEGVRLTDGAAALASVGAHEPRDLARGACASAS